MKFDSSRILTRDYPRSEYKPSKESSLDDCVVKSLHFGQRKLFLSEVEFLTAILEKDGGKPKKPILVVYAGAANGSHLPYLFDLFPEVRFVVIDPAPFCAEVRALSETEGSAVVELVQDYCTDELCLRLARTYESTYTVYLISDIRSGVPTRMQTNAEHTEMMLRDNAMQKSWCWSLRAEAAMLKFHPPYPAVKDTESRRYEPDDKTPETIEYLDGQALFGVWSPKSSSEVRLVVEGPFTSDYEAKMRVYCCQEHEEQCYHYNTNDRYAKDVAAERLILERYLCLFPSHGPTADVLSAKLSEKLNFPLFKPLADGFTEDNARWMYLLCSVRNPTATRLFEQMRSSMTISAVKRLVSSYSRVPDVPVGQKVGDVTLDEEFWQIFCRGDFAEAYTFPKIRWAFFKRLASQAKGQQPSKRRRIS